MNTRPSFRFDRVLLPGVILVAALAHIAALGNSLVGDSWVFVYPRTLGETLAYFHTSIIPPDGQAFWLRPLPMLTFWLENLLYSGTAWLPHLTNILFHVLNVFLLWRVVTFMIAPYGKERTEGGLAAAAACLFYGIHPLTVGSVGWVAARFDVVCVTFGLAGLLDWMRWDAGRGGTRSLLAGSALLTGALLSKEQGVVFFMAAFLLTALRAVRGPVEERRDARAGLVIPAGIAVVYFVYRITIFGGVGGYVTARNGLSLLVPLNYLAAVLYPWPNVVRGWVLSWPFWASTGVLLALGGLLWARPPRGRGVFRGKYALAVATLLFLALATTMPNAGMTLQVVVGHAESRFALIPVAAFALLIGLAVSLLRGEVALRAVIGVLLIWGVAAAWRTTVQIQAWHGAGKVAQLIVSETVQLVPDPAPRSSLILLDIPRNTDQYAYIFGIGLDYALRAAYGRDDVRFVRFPTREDLRRANPDRDAVVQFVRSTGHMERLRAVRGQSGEEAASSAEAGQRQ